MRKKIYINHEWSYRPDFNEDYIKEAYVEEGFDKVSLPHTNIELPYNCFNEKDYQFISTYRRLISMSPQDKGKRVFIDFEAVMLVADVYINGLHLGTHKGGFTPFSFELTDYLEVHKENVLVVKVDSRERKDVPPFGHVVDFLTFGGIYREVSLRMVNPNYIERVLVTPKDVLKTKKSLGITMDVHHDLPGLAVELDIRDLDGRVIARKLKTPIRKNKLAIDFEDIEGVDIWMLENPKLYELVVTLFKEDQVLDTYECRFGFREQVFKADGFYLNGVKTKLIGLNRHQSYPYVGYAMPERAQKKDADLLKFDLGLNMVRTSHYPQSRHFLDRCDEIGLLVFEEIPGWQHIGDEEWQAISLREMEAMIYRDFNRPSVVLWGVRINESSDHHDFYSKTNALAKELDPTRQTSGVRCIEGSELLEDVYAMNDFAHDGGKRVLRSRKAITKQKTDLPYLVSEFNGHKYPTKRFDQELRMIEHANRHARVINHVLGDDEISGGLGWCAFDYNTHKDFGSGDKVCYHGVMDMFRIPKLAASAYQSQKSPEDEVVMTVGSLLAKGERDGGGYFPITLYSNCDEVEVFMGDKPFAKAKAQRESYEHLSYPPMKVERSIGESFKRAMAMTSFNKSEQKRFREFVKEMMENHYKMSTSSKLFIVKLMLKYRLKGEDIRDIVMVAMETWGEKDASLTFVGKRHGMEVIRKKIGGMVYMDQLSIKADDHKLSLGKSTYDVTRVVVKALDQRGNILPFSSLPIDIKIDGPGQVMGPSRLALIGGCIAFWVKTTGEVGTINLSLQSPCFKSDNINIEVE